MNLFVLKRLLASVVLYSEKLFVDLIIIHMSCLNLFCINELSLYNSSNKCETLLQPEYDPLVDSMHVLPHSLTAGIYHKADAKKVDSINRTGGEYVEFKHQCFQCQLKESFN